MHRLRIALIGVAIMPAVMLAGCGKPATGQKAASTHSVYDPRETFAPLTLPTM